MAKIPAAQKRLFENVFVCKKCKTKKRSTMKHVLLKKIKCRRCNGKDFRPIKKK